MGRDGRLRQGVGWQADCWALRAGWAGVAVVLVGVCVQEAQDRRGCWDPFLGSRQELCFQLGRARGMGLMMGKTGTRHPGPPSPRVPCLPRPLPSMARMPRLSVGLYCGSLGPVLTGAGKAPGPWVVGRQGSVSSHAPRMPLSRLGRPDRQAGLWTGAPWRGGLHFSS